MDTLIAAYLMSRARLSLQRRRVVELQRRRSKFVDVVSRKCFRDAILIDRRWIIKSGVKVLRNSYERRKNGNDARFANQYVPRINKKLLYCTWETFLTFMVIFSNNHYEIYRYDIHLLQTLKQRVNIYNVFGIGY